MREYHVLLAVIAAVFVTGCSATDEPLEPNIVLMVADDLGLPTSIRSRRTGCS